MFDVLTIGCGVTGAACAYTLSKYDLKIGILEANNDVAAGTTKANSAVVHAGFDAQPGTLKARLNVRGSELMEELCAQLGVGLLLFAFALFLCLNKQTICLRNSILHYFFHFVRARLISTILY